MPRSLKSILVPALCASTFLGLSGSFARAADVPVTPPPANWWDTLTVSGSVDAGITFNPDSPGDGLNFGHLFTDKANQPLLNQMLLTVQRPLDPKATDYDFGFKVQAMYGTDARYIHYLGELDYIINDWSQITPVEAWGIVHLPWLFAGGIDVKAGQYVTLEGAETIDPTTNYLYSHSYIFNFGIPLVHTGIMTISHVDPMVDIYAGVDTGVNTTFGNHQGDNNGAAAFHGGIGLNLLDGNLTILATTHIGPEIPDTNGFNNTVDNITSCGCNPNNSASLSQRHHGDMEGHRLCSPSSPTATSFAMMGSTRPAMASRNTASTRPTTGCRLSGAPRFGATTTTSSSRLSLAISTSSTPSMAFPTRRSSPPRQRPIWS